MEWELNKLIDWIMATLTLLCRQTTPIMQIGPHRLQQLSTGALHSHQLYPVIILFSLMTGEHTMTPYMDVCIIVAIICAHPMLCCWSFLAFTPNWPVALFLLLLHPPGTLYLLTFDCAKAFSLSNATWKPICSNSLGPPVLPQAPLYLQT